MRNENLKFVFFISFKHLNLFKNITIKKKKNIINLLNNYFEKIKIQLKNNANVHVGELNMKNK